jgi:guanylate kinase
MTLVALAGPAGVGKGTVVRRLLEQHPEFSLSVSATTRGPRPGEIDGVHYHFVSEAEFDRLIAQDELLEWAEVHRQHRYGTPRSELSRAEAAGKVLVLEIDLQGVRQVRERVSEVVSIFLLPPSQQELEDRLRLRGTESEAEIARRLETARVELAAAEEFDHRLINNEVDECVAEIVDLVFPMKENHDRKA